MDLDAVKIEFKNACALDLSNEGFKYLKKREAFWRQTESGFEELVHCRIVEVGEKQIEPSFSIRHLEIERIFHEAMGTPKRFRDMTSVIWPRAGLLIPGEDGQFTIEVAAGSSVTTSANAFLAVYRDFGRDFFRSCSSLREFDRVLNSAPLELCPFQPSPLHRCSFGVIVAMMVRGNVATETVEAHRSVVEQLDDGFHVSKFDNLVSAVSSLAR